MPGARELLVALTGTVGETALMPPPTNHVMDNALPPGEDVDDGGGIVGETGGVCVELLDGAPSDFVPP